MFDRVGEKRIRNRYREAAALSVLWNSTQTKGFRSFAWAAIIMMGLAVLATSSSGNSSLWSLYGARLASRGLDSVQGFPQTKESRDADVILRTYPAYLTFALEVAKEVDAANAKKLQNSYDNLRKRSPEGAVRFLKGLRFEMVQKLELMGMPATRVSTRTPEVRRWIGRFTKEWAREADEYLFRAVATPRGE